MTVAALVSNCTLLKPAETSCVIAKLTEILVEAGIPRSVSIRPRTWLKGGCLPG